MGVVAYVASVVSVVCTQYPVSFLSCGRLPSYPPNCSCFNDSRFIETQTCGIGRRRRCLKEMFFFEPSLKRSYHWRKTKKPARISALGPLGLMVPSTKKETTIASFLLLKTLSLFCDNWYISIYILHHCYIAASAVDNFLRACDI